MTPYDRFDMSYLDYVTSAVKVVVGFIAIGLGTLYVFQDSMLYYPNPPGLPKTVNENPTGMKSPKQWNKDGSSNVLPGASSDPIPLEDTFVTSDDGAKIHVWLMLQDDSANVPTLIYFHGNAGNMGFRLKNAAMMYAVCKINVLMMDYRGYGSSTGTPNEKGLNLDAEGVLNFAKAHPKLKNSKMVAFGRSLGGAVALQLAKKRPDDIAGVILENTFLSISAMVDTLLPHVAAFKTLILRIGWYNDRVITELTHPIMFISGQSDELVPPRHMLKLYELATMSKHRDLFKVPRGRHNDTFEKAGRDYYIRLKAFFDKVMGISSSTTESSFCATNEDIDESGVDAAIPTMNKNFGVTRE